MNRRLKKKAFFLSLVGHVAVLIALALSPAFKPKPRDEEPHIVQVLPSQWIEQALTPPQPKPEPVAPKPEPVAPKPEPVAPKPKPVAPKPKPVAPKPKPVAPKPKPVAPKPKPVAPKPKPVAPKPEPVVSKPKPKPVAPKPKADMNRRVRRPPVTQPTIDRKAVTAQTAKRATLIDKLTQRLATSTVLIDFSGLPSTGADDYSRYVRQAYFGAWTAPKEISEAVAVARAKITIASDGSVVAKETSLVKPSGNTALDQSVRRTLAFSPKLPPFEPGARESKRTYFINFKLTANGR